VQRLFRADEMSIYFIVSYAVLKWVILSEYKENIWLVWL